MMTITILMKQLLKAITAMRMMTTSKAKMRELTSERKKPIKIEKTLKQPPPKKTKKKQKCITDYINS